MYSTVEYLLEHERSAIRIAGVYDQDWYEIEYMAEEVDQEYARRRAEQYVEFAREDYERVTGSGPLPYDDYHADIRMFDPATIVNLPLTGKDYSLLFSINAASRRNLRGLVRQLHREAYQKPPAPFR